LDDIFGNQIDNNALKLGVNTANGEIIYEAVARDLGYQYIPAEKALEKELMIK